MWSQPFPIQIKDIRENIIQCVNHWLELGCIWFKFQPNLTGLTRWLNLAQKITSTETGGAWGDGLFAPVNVMHLQGVHLLFTFSFHLQRRLKAPYCVLMTCLFSSALFGDILAFTKQRYRAKWLPEHLRNDACWWSLTLVFSAAHLPTPYFKATCKRGLWGRVKLEYNRAVSEDEEMDSWQRWQTRWLTRRVPGSFSGFITRTCHMCVSLETCYL